MRPSDFELFIGVFAADNRNLDATDRSGRSVLDIVRTHRHGKPYAEALVNAGAGQTPS